MNHHTPHISPAEAAGSLATINAANEARRFRSLALNMRRHSHNYREWARQSASDGHKSAEAAFIRTAQRYIADALWYWRRSRAEPVQFNTQRTDA